MRRCGEGHGEGGIGEGGSVDEAGEGDGEGGIGCEGEGGIGCEDDMHEQQVQMHTWSIGMIEDWGSLY
jgi:hypothetical protein